MMTKIQQLSLKEKKTLLQKMVKLQEEVGELAQEVLLHQKASGGQYKSHKEHGILEESIDILLVALSIFFSEGGTSEKYEELLSKKVEKWEKFQH